MKKAEALAPASCEPKSMLDFSRKLFNNFVFAIFCLVMSLLTAYVFCPGCRTDTGRFMLITGFSFCLWISLWPCNAFIARLIDKKISWVETPGKRFLFGVMSTVVCSFVIVLAFIWIFKTAFDFSLGSNTSGTIFYTVLFTIICSTFLYGQKFLMNWRKLELDAVTLRNENLSSQYESLKNQLDPHFLFNSLNVLTNLVYEDPDKSARFIKQLSEVYRYLLDTRGREFVTVKEEMKFVDAYLYLQQIRFGDKLIVDNKLGDIDGHVPPLVIQMLIENAIKHNTISSERPLIISLYEREGNLVVENNLQVRDKIYTDSLGIGLSNIRRRYEYLSSRLVNISQDDGKFKVDLPLLSVQQ